jgi:hypothetical protein
MSCHGVQAAAIWSFLFPQPQLIILIWMKLSGTTIRGTQIRTKVHHESNTNLPHPKKINHKKTYGLNLPSLDLQRAARAWQPILLLHRRPHARSIGTPPFYPSPRNDFAHLRLAWDRLGRQLSANKLPVLPEDPKRGLRRRKLSASPDPGLWCCFPIGALETPYDVTHVLEPTSQTGQDG